MERIPSQNLDAGGVSKKTARKSAEQLLKLIGQGAETTPIPKRTEDEQKRCWILRHRRRSGVV